MKYGFIKSKLTGKEEVFTKSLKVPENFRYQMDTVLNLGDEPICTVCATSAFLNWNYKKNFNILDIFKNSKPEKDGAELKNVFTYLLNKKLITNYALIKSDLSLKVAILLNGPCVAALPVYSDSKQFWNGTTLLGGHAIAIVGWNKDGFIIRNSWGSSWGDRGYTVLPYKDFKKFIEIWTLIK